MAKIAAIVLPAGRRDRMETLAGKVSSLLSPGHDGVEQQQFRGETSLCCLIRVAPDVFNPEPQPASRGGRPGVMCGYYISRHPGSGVTPPSPAAPGDSANRLLRDVAERGVDSLVSGDGVYAFAQWDPREERLVAGVDKLGMRPLFRVAIAGGGYAVATEIKALVPFAGEPLVNWAAWEEQLAFGYPFGTHTVFSGIHRFGPAEVLWCDAHHMQLSQVENFLSGITVRPRSTADFLEENHAAFCRSMDRCQSVLTGSEDHSLLLSGGYDSRRIFGWMLNHGPKFQVFTMPAVQPDGSEYESGIVAAVCRKYGVPGSRVAPSSPREHALVHEVRDFALDFESHEHYLAAVLAVALRKPGSVNYDGLGAGILINGAFLKPEYFLEGGDRKFRSTLSTRFRSWFSVPRSHPPLRERLTEYLDGFGDDPNRHTLFYFLSRTRRSIALSSINLVGNTFETFFPYLDREVVASALSFPPQQKPGQELQRSLIGAFGSGLLDVPTTHDPSARSDPRFVTPPPEWSGAARPARKSVGPRGAGPVLPTWGLRAPERLKFWLDDTLPFLLNEGRRSDNRSRRRTLQRLGRYIDATRSPEVYTERAATVLTHLGTRPDWVVPI